MIGSSYDSPSGRESGGGGGDDDALLSAPPARIHLEDAPENFGHFASTICLLVSAVPTYTYMMIITMMVIIAEWMIVPSEVY